MSSYEKTTMIDPEDQSEVKQEEKKAVDWYHCIYRGGFIILLVVALICLYYLSVFFIARMPDTEDLEARLMGHAHRRLTCENVHERLPEFYGCCEVVDENNQRFTTSVHRTLKKDEEGSNCPSYHSILLKAQKYYNEYKDYFQNSYGKPNGNDCVKAGVTFPFKNCPSTEEIIVKYDLYFPWPYEDICLLIILFIILCCLFACSDLDCGHTYTRKRGRKARR